MANRPVSNKRFIGGIADFLKENAVPDAFYFSRAINYRDDPQSLTLLPGALKESGSVVTDLLKWGDIVPATLNTYYYGNTGNIYQRNTSATWSFLHQAPTSHGNGFAYFAGDDYIYYPTDKSIGRYGPIQNSPTFTDDFLQAQGGVPQNTASLLLASASSQYATAADSASLEVTGNITLETFFKANSLPTAGNAMTLVAKWDESGATRGYRLDLYGISGFFGAGTDGALTISSNTTDTPIDSACSGTAGTQSLTATNASFAANQVILIHQTQGTNVGQWERNTIQGYTAGTITLGTPLLGSYSGKAQVLVLKQYTNVTVNTSITWTAKGWNGTTGGILAFLANGTFTSTGTTSAVGQAGQAAGAGGTGVGFAGAGVNAGNVGNAGEGSIGGIVSATQSANGTGGGGGKNTANAPGGGGNGVAGNIGAGTFPGSGGGTSGSVDLTNMTFGGGGGSGAGGVVNGGGGAGGGIIFASAVTITVTGAITANGGQGGAGSDQGGGGGAGGSILLKCQTATLGTNLVTATGATGGGVTSGAGGGSGGNGRININYLTSFTGTTNPTLNSIKDSTLVTTVQTQARFGVSNDGTSNEFLPIIIPNLVTGMWNRLSVAWVASTSTATFYLNGRSIGTSVGTKTSISSNASLLYVGANKGAASVGNFFDGLLNDMRVWNIAQTASLISSYNLSQLKGTEAGLVAYYTFNSVYYDKTTNANNLTAQNSPVFSTDVPFPAPTTRLDIDQQQST